MHQCALPENNGGMNKPLDLPDVTLQASPRVGDPYLLLTHKKTGMEAVISRDRLNAWLLRQLRQELVSTKEQK